VDLKVQATTQTTIRAIVITAGARFVIVIVVVAVAVVVAVPAASSAA
jgi:hypothetical protein